MDTVDGRAPMSHEPAPSLHPLLAARWSPREFDATYDVPPAAVETLLEAARWAPSAGNSQPWAFLTARRGDPAHARVLRNLAPSSARWAPTASLLVVNLCRRFVEGSDLEYSEFSLYDLGQAVAHMTVQAQSLGLHARQFRAFRQDALAAELDVPDHWQVTTITAFGRLPAGVTEPVDTGSDRQRRDLAEIRWPVPL